MVFARRALLSGVIVAVALALVCGCTPGQQATPDPSGSVGGATVAATVSGTPISVRALEDEVARVLSDPAEAKLAKANRWVVPRGRYRYAQPNVVDLALTNLVLLKVERTYLSRRHIDIASAWPAAELTDPDPASSGVARVDGGRDPDPTPQRVATVFLYVASGGADQHTARAYFSRDPKQFEQVCVSQLSFATRDVAASVARSLAAGHSRAAVLAAVPSSSILPGSHRLGCFPRNVGLPQALTQTLFRLPVGRWSGVEHVGTSYSLYQVTARVNTFEKLQLEVTNSVARRQLEAAATHLGVSLSNGFGRFDTNKLAVAGGSMAVPVP